MDLSSINQVPAKSASSVEQFLDKALQVACRFCGEASGEALVQVCGCARENSAHRECLEQEEGALCEQCQQPFELQQEDPRESSILVTPADQMYSTPRASSLSESSGEERMRRIIKAAVLKPHCRICKSADDEPRNKLIYPCQCHSVDPKEAWAHRNCIFEYALARQNDVCQRCKAPYAFTADYLKQWVCANLPECHRLSVALLLHVLVMAICLCLLVYVWTEAADEELGWVLVGGLLLVGILDVVAAGSTICRSLYVYKTHSLQVLCQKHEIAHMNKNSHQMFLQYLGMLRAEHRLPEPLAESLPKKEVKKEAKKERKKEASAHSDRSEESKQLVELSEYDGENFESEGIRELSEVGLFSESMST